MRIIPILILSLMILLSSCKKIDKLTNFYIPIEEELIVNPSEADDFIIDSWLFIAQITEVGYFADYNTSVEATDKIALSELYV